MVKSALILLGVLAVFRLIGWAAVRYLSLHEPQPQADLSPPDDCWLVNTLYRN